MRHHHDHQPARAAHRRPADPDTTDAARRHLAVIAHECPLPGICGINLAMSLYIAAVTDAVPDLDAATAARIVMAVAGLHAAVKAAMATPGVPAARLSDDAVALMAAAGGRMYLEATGQTETEH